MFFKSIVFGAKIIAFTGNRNTLFCKDLNKHSQRWKMILKQYGVELKFVEGTKNNATDSLSRLNTISTSANIYKFNFKEISEKQLNCFFLSKIQWQNY